MIKLFGGISLESKTETQRIEWTIKPPPLPQRVRIPLYINESLFCHPLVKVGDTVKAGEKIGAPANDDSVFIHASLSGTVQSIQEFAHPILGKSPAIEIVSDETDDFALSPLEEQTKPTPEKFRELFRNYGLLDLRFPVEAVHSKIQRAQKLKIKTLVINACQNEPYVSSDYSLMMSHPVEILKGIEVIRKAVGSEKVLIAMGEKDREAAELLQSKIFFLKWQTYEVERVASLYPQGNDRVLNETLHNKRKDLEISESSSELFNVATGFSVYEAFYEGKPLTQRTVTMAGECLAEKKNMWFRLGTSFQEAVKMCRGFLRDPRKVVMGGPMTGLAQSDLEVSIMATTQAILGLPSEVAVPEQLEPCIRCGACNDACPISIQPAMIALASEFDQFEEAIKYGASRCIECGNCSYVCPSKRPMVELIRQAKSLDSMKTLEKI